MRSVNVSGGLCVSAISARLSRSRTSGMRGDARRTVVSSVLALLWLPLGDRDRRVAHLRTVAVQRDFDVLQPLLVVARREVGTELCPARLGALDRRHHDRL